MKLIKKIIAVLLLSFGIPFSLYALIELSNPKTSPEDRENSLAALIIFTLPSTAIGGWLLWGIYQEKKQKQQVSLERSEENLRTIFFELLEANEGKITVLQMAKAANFNAEKASEYLEKKLQEFNGISEINDEGVIIYKFPI